MNNEDINKYMAEYIKLDIEIVEGLRLYEYIKLRRMSNEFG